MSSRSKKPKLRAVTGQAPPADAHPLVLIVDDEAAWLRVLVRALHSAPLRVVTAESAIHAMQLLHRQKVAVVLSDQRMFGPTGVDLLDAVQVRWPGMRRILMTGWLDSELALKARYHRVVQKNMSLKLLRDIIEQEAKLAR